MKKSINHIIYILLFALAGVLTCKNVLAQNATVSLLIAYTPQTADSIGGNQSAINKIKDAVQQLNNAYNNSGVHHQTVLVRTVRLDNAETDCFVNDLNSFQANAYISALRDKYHADIAVVVLNNKTFSGLPYLDDTVASSSTAYCAINYVSMINKFGLSHQVAHLYGCSHYAESSSEASNVMYPYGHGYYWGTDESPRLFSTIVGEDDDDFYEDNGVDSSTMIPYFSNPDSSYQGEPLGFDGVNNSVKVLNDNANAIKAFKLIPISQQDLSDTVNLYNVAFAMARDSLSTGDHYIITNTASVRFQAGRTITLNPGFTANEGAHFEASVVSNITIDPPPAPPVMLAHSSTNPTARSNTAYTKMDFPTKEPENLISEDIKIYPNPSSGIFTIATHNINNGVIEVYDMLGHIIQKTTLNAKSSYQFNLSGYAKGMYILNIIANNKKYTNKIIIQ